MASDTVMRMECSICTRLRSDLDRVERSYAKALELMAIHAADTHEYWRLRAQAQLAEVFFEMACAKLEEHQQTHAELEVEPPKVLVC